MIDGISLLIRYLEDIKTIGQNKNLKFKTYNSYQLADYKGLRIKLRANSCWINGSLHRFKNGGEHNADDFTYSDLQDTLMNLCKEIGITPEYAEIKNIEVGINIKLPYDPFLFIQSVVKRERRYPVFTSIGLEFQYSQYIIKIYSKSKQDKRWKDDNILRMEIRFNKMIEAKRELGQIEYLNDLLEPSFWFHSGRCLNFLLNNIDIIDIEKIIREDIPNEDRVQLLAWRYRDAWEKCSTKRKRMRDEIHKICEPYSLTDIKESVQRMIECKVTELQSYPRIQEYCLQVEASRKMLQTYI